MRTLVLRRHSLREPGAPHLSAEGRTLATEVGAQSGPFARVLTSPLPRAGETARAMGFRVDGEWPELGRLSEPVGRFLERESPGTFGEYVRWVVSVHEVRAAAETLATRIGAEVDRLPDGSSLLMISHGGIIELATAGALPDLAQSWGPSLAPLEGVRWEREGGRWVRGEPLRRPT
jgi:broad specificity phosphatase PhoE